MKINNWLTINNKGCTRLTKSKPSTSWNEISMKLNIELPDLIFNRPALEANIKLEGDFNIKHEGEIKNNLKDIIEFNENLHLVSVNIIKDESEEKEE